MSPQKYDFDLENNFPAVQKWHTVILSQPAVKKVFAMKEAFAAAASQHHPCSSKTCIENADNFDSNWSSVSVMLEIGLHLCSNKFRAFQCRKIMARIKYVINERRRAYEGATKIFAEKRKNKPAADA
ncbi:hypothetical protein A0H81_07370 [Grifola frondosa]|uniref:Uncharacterized protein n=1 Tax=Grifola frondosa TaxID=5627 RepID=A0A1C7M509_GRIFR|nr:hypothetical protein A0H81_07370 [Grifola frondosa]